MEFLVVQVLSDEELTKLSWPVTEFAKDKKGMFSQYTKLVCSNTFVMHFE